jgi:acyl carrier protein
MDKIIEILNAVHPYPNYAKETRLVDDRILDSFDIIMLVSELSETFGVEIDLEYLEPENFNSVKAMYDLLVKLGADL